MGDRIFLTKPVFERLVEHMVSIEENGGELADFYYPCQPVEQANMRKLFSEYVKKIEAELEKIEVINSIEKYRSTKNLNEFTIAIIGSQVEIMDMAGNNSFAVRLVHPSEHSRHGDEITYLSPLGKELLLKEKDSEFIVNMPEGEKRFRVKSVKLYISL